MELNDYEKVSGFQYYESMNEIYLNFIVLSSVQFHNEIQGAMMNSHMIENATKNLLVGVMDNQGVWHRAIILGLMILTFWFFVA